MMGHNTMSWPRRVERCEGSGFYLLPTLEQRLFIDAADFVRSNEPVIWLSAPDATDDAPHLQQAVSIHVDDTPKALLPARTAITLLHDE